MKKSDHPQDITITNYEDVVECCCRFKNRYIGVIFIKETKTFQTYVKAYFGKENIDSNFGIISNNRGVKLGYIWINGKPYIDNNEWNDYNQNTCYNITNGTKQSMNWYLNGKCEIIPFDELDNSKLYIPNCRMVPTRDFGNDQFAFSSSENMDDYAAAYHWIDTFYESGVQYMCEDFMSANWKRAGLVGEKLMYCDINHPFPPGPYNGTPHSLIREDFEQWLK